MRRGRFVRKGREGLVGVRGNAREWWLWFGGLGWRVLGHEFTHRHFAHGDRNAVDATFDA